MLWPCAFIMGVDVIDCLPVGRMLGIRAIATLGLSFIELGKLNENKEDFNEYRNTYNDTVTLNNNDLFLPQWNQTLIGGVLTVS